MLHGFRVLVVVPALDEAPRIGRVVRTMPAFVDTIVLCDDGSADGTIAAAEACGDSRLHVVSHAARKGVGAAIVSGYRAALDLTVDPRDAFAVMAGDAQMDPADLERVVAPIALGEADYVKGERFSDARILRTMSPQRWVGGQVFSALTRVATGLSITDSQCGYTALSRAACLALDLDDLWTGYGYPNDMLGQLAVRRLRVAEVPVRPIYADEISRLRLRHLGRITTLTMRAGVRRAQARIEAIRAT